MNFFVDDFYKNIAITLISILALSGVYAAVYFFHLRKIDNVKKKKRLSARWFYVIGGLFIVILARAGWTGFTQLWSFLSLIAAGFVIANKELVMNLIGWLIINWRGVFAEGDYIEILDHKGFVYELGVLYFKIFEASQNSVNRTSGRTIKIPNGLVTIHAVVNYSRNTNFIEYYQTWDVPRGVSIDAAKTLVLRIAKSVVANFYQNVREYTADWLQKRNKMLARLMDLDVHVKVTKHERTRRDQLILSYYCYPKDQEEISSNLLSQIAKQLSCLNELKLATQVQHTNVEELPRVEVKTEAKSEIKLEKIELVG